MSISLWQVIILAAVQGLTELLPVSSSAHVVVAEKLMGVDPSTPEMTLLLVMLHTGTMFAVIVYFWRKWRAAYFQSLARFGRFAMLVLLATAITGIVGEALIKVLERVAFPLQSHGEVEQLFGHLELIAPALAAVGVLILMAGILKRGMANGNTVSGEIGLGQAGLIGAVQGLCLPFRGFSRSGATISTGMLAGVPRVSAENFSFALAVVLTPTAVAREAFRLIKAEQISSGADLASAIVPSMIGAVFAFLAGLIALKWLSRWLEHGLWYLFGIYCLMAGAAVALLYHAGY
jgi:undecaprenyl-diphosphatase